MTCRVCRSQTVQKGFLHRCSSSQCSAANWDKRSLKKVFNKVENKEFSKQRLFPDLEAILAEADVPYKEKAPGKFVYLIRLRGKRAEGAKGKIYVGKTGLHPYERFLHHIATRVLQIRLLNRVKVDESPVKAHMRAKLEDVWSDQILSIELEKMAKRFA